MKGNWSPLDQFDDAARQYKILQLIAMFRSMQLLSYVFLFELCGVMNLVASGFPDVSIFEAGIWACNRTI